MADAPEVQHAGPEDRLEHAAVEQSQPLDRQCIVLLRIGGKDACDTNELLDDVAAGLLRGQTGCLVVRRAVEIARAPEGLLRGVHGRGPLGAFCVGELSQERVGLAQGHLVALVPRFTASHPPRVRGRPDRDAGLHR